MFEKCQQFWGPERSRRVLEGSGRIAMFWVVPKEYHLAVLGISPELIMTWLREPDVKNWCFCFWLFQDTCTLPLGCWATAAVCYWWPVWDFIGRVSKGGGWHMLAQQTMSLHWIISCHRQFEKVKSRPHMWHIKCLPSKWWRDGLTNRHLLCLRYRGGREQPSSSYLEFSRTAKIGIIDYRKLSFADRKCVQFCLMAEIFPRYVTNVTFDLFAWAD